MPEMMAVKSGMIESVGHEGETLYVKFRNGGMYKYTPVSAIEYQEMLASDSVGGYFSQNIKKTKNYEKVGENGESSS